MKRILAPIAVVLVILGFLVWWMSPTQVVKRRTSSLMNTLTMAEGSGQAERQSGSFSLTGLLEKELTLEAPNYEEANGTFDRTTVESGFSALANNAKFTKFEVKEFREVEVVGDEATVTAQVESVVALPEFRPLDGLYEVTMIWRKEEDGWRLAKAKWSESR